MNTAFPARFTIRPILLARPILTVLAACVVIVFFQAEAQAGARRGAGAGAGAAAAKAPDRDQYSLQMQSICEADFARWDRNHDDKLDYREINALIENLQVRGDEAAAVVALRFKLPKTADGTNGPSLTRAQVMALTADYDTWQHFFRLSQKIPTIKRTLFLPGDPALRTLKQGPVGDCYFIGVLGAVVSRDANALRNMIKQLPDGSYEVRFPNREPIHVSAMTDSELMMGSPEGSDHGIWTAVIEKGFAEVRREIKQDRNGIEIDDDEATTTDLLGGGGLMGTSVKTFTGHDSKAIRVGALAKKDPANAAEQVHAVLCELNKYPNRIMALGMAKKQLPPGLVGGHCYGILHYDETKRVVRLFNPWGNEFTPKGAPGMANGYVTRFGTFDIPLKDLVQVCARLAHDLGPANSQAAAAPQSDSGK